MLLISAAISAEIEVGREDWLEKIRETQRKTERITFDYVQVKKLALFRKPQEVEGKFWFERPEKFRIEMGSPPQLILIGNEEGIWRWDRDRNSWSKLRDPNEQGTVEEMTLVGRWSMGLLENFEEISHIDAQLDGKEIKVQLVPNEGISGNKIKEITLWYSLTSFLPKRSVVLLAGGDKVTNEFTSVKINPRFPTGLFEVDSP